MRVLVVDDDRALGMFVQRGLRLEGHEAEWVGDGEAALEQAELHPPDLMVLDLSLPRRDGTEVLETMQERFAGTSVLVLTGRNGLEERIRCLNLGADDCLLKPFSFHELSARCRAIERRKHKHSDPLLRFGGVEMDRMERTVRHEGAPVDLTVKEYSLLEFLVKRQGQCCTRAELLTEVWQMAPECGTNIVDVYVNYLRKKLGAAGFAGVSDSVIETVRGTGYRLRGGRKPPMSVQAYLPMEFVRGA